MEKVIRINARRPPKDPGYEIKLGAGNLSTVGDFAQSAFDTRPKRIGLVSNEKVFQLFGRNVKNDLQRAGFEVSVWLMKEGERFKNLRSLEAALRFFNESGLTRTDAAVALGGGVVGDLTGFAASVHLRGIPYIQIPTTLLAMIDSSVGGKTGINTEFGKNLAGTFYQPKGVLIDPMVLVTLTKRELTAGLSESIKQAAVAGKQLFKTTDSIVRVLDSYDFAELLKTNAFRSKFEIFLERQIAFKAKIVAGDERESPGREDPKSRKILNFGHTFAHALERATNYRYLKHGEAVGYGVAFAAEVSKKLGLLEPEVVNLLRDVVNRSGRLPAICKIDPNAVFEALRFDKKNVNASIRWVLLEDIGKPVIVPHEKIGDKLVLQTINEFISANRLPN
jgi:3-dehydroquinate synthase